MRSFPAVTPALRLSALYVAAAVSGAAALVYEMLWIRRLGEVLGSTAYAVQLVLAIFFGGLGLGAWLGGRLADLRRGSMWLYVGLEVWIAAWGLAFWPAVELAEELCSRASPEEWAAGRTLAAKGIAAALVLAPPTLAMGASLPVLVRHAVRADSHLSARLAGLYGWNTVGAALGVALAMLWWIPTLGLRRSAVAAGLLNVAASALALAGRLPREEPTVSAPAPQAIGTPSDRAVLGGAVLLAGFVSVGMELLWTRALAARFLSTVYSFATILVAFLLCLGSGALFLRTLERRGWLRPASAGVVMTAAGLGCLLSVAMLARMQPFDLEASAGRGWAALQRRELWQALAVMLVPVWLFGLNFPLLARLSHRELRSVGGELGTLYLLNTIGSVAAPLVLAFAMLPRVGLKTSLLACGVTAIFYGLFVLLPWAGVPARHRRAGLGCTAAFAAGALWAAGGDVRLWRESDGDRLLHYEDAAAASVAVVETRDGNRLLKIDNHYRLGATRNWFAQERQALVPILLGGEPRSVLILGMATGSSAGAAAAWGGLEVDILEILPGLGELLPFFSESNSDLARRLESDPDVRLLEVDGRHFIRSTRRKYDLVLGDLFIPWRAGEGAMYTLEHFRAVRAVLRPGGTFCQWLPLYQLRPADLRTITRTFCEVFPDVQLYWLYFNATQPAVGLIGSDGLERKPLDRAAFPGDRQRLLERTGLSEAAPLYGSWIAGGTRLRAWTAGAPLETQDRPRIEFRAPAHRLASALPPAVENVAVMLELMQPLDDPGPYRGDRGLTASVIAYRHAIARFFRAEQSRLYQDDPAGTVRELAAALSAAPDWGWIAWNFEQLVRAHAAGPRTDLALDAAKALGHSPRFAAQGAFLEAYVFRQRGDTAAARSALERALAADPQHVPSHRLLDELGTR